MSSQSSKTPAHYKWYIFMNSPESSIGYAPAVSTLDTSVGRGMTDARKPLINPHEAERSKLFFDHIGRPDLKEKITSLKPWSYWTMELYTDFIKGQGGLGMLASDTLGVAKRLGIPMVFVTPFYSVERSHEVVDFQQWEKRQVVRPEDRGFKKEGQVFIATSFHREVPLGVYVRKEGSVSVVTVYEPNMGELYQGESNSNHRLYQEVALGFGGYKALKALSVVPSMNQQLNEAPTVFSALARLDERTQEIQSENPDVKQHAVFAKALIEIKKNTIYTNHTLVQAAEAEISSGQFEDFVIPNIKSATLRDWLRQKIVGKGGHIKLSTLAIELSGKRNGVSKAHAKEASRTYKDYDGELVEFKAVTNGIFLDRWGCPDLLTLYRERKVIDDFDLSSVNLPEKLAAIEESKLRKIKENAKIELKDMLRRRVDQYSNGVEIPEGAKIYNWRRRLADYKRPEMIFDDPKLLADILEKEDIHFVMAGNVHPTDMEMRSKLKSKILEVIDANPILKKRVHFIQDYDEELGKYLSRGADVSVNTPEVRNHETGERKFTEACGTSWEKDILNNNILISTDDGGVADLAFEAEESGVVNFEPPYLQISGKTYKEEVQSLYSQMKKAASIISGKDSIAWGDFIKRQSSAYLPIISGARMEEHYINLGFPAVA